MRTWENHRDVSEDQLNAAHCGIFAKKSARRERPDASRPQLFAAPPPQPQPKPFTGIRIDGVLHFDGSCFPNPGESQCGFALHVGMKIVERSIRLGHGTNNTAEYNGAIHGLRAALELGVTHLEIYGDSQLVIRGLQKGPWAKGKPHLEVLKKESLELMARFSVVDLNWVPREENARADELSTAGVDALTRV
jgi:ribonuclease HI